MTKLSKLVLICFVFVLVSYKTACAQIQITGKWQSTSKNVFYVVDTEEGFKYQNAGANVGKTWFFAKWQNKYDLNKYLVYKDSDGKALEFYFTVKKENGASSITIYDAKTGATTSWVKIGD